MEDLDTVPPPQPAPTHKHCFAFSKMHLKSCQLSWNWTPYELLPNFQWVFPHPLLPLILVFHRPLNGKSFTSIFLLFVLIECGPVPKGRGSDTDILILSELYRRWAISGRDPSFSPSQLFSVKQGGGQRPPPPYLSLIKLKDFLWLQVFWK